MSLVRVASKVRWKGGLYARGFSPGSGSGSPPCPCPLFHLLCLGQEGAVCRRWDTHDGRRAPVLTELMVSMSHQDHIPHQSSGLLLPFISAHSLLCTQAKRFPPVKCPPCFSWCEFSQPQSPARGPPPPGSLPRSLSRKQPFPALGPTALYLMCTFLCWGQASFPSRHSQGQSTWHRTGAHRHVCCSVPSLARRPAPAQSSSRTFCSCSHKQFPRRNRGIWVLLEKSSESVAEEGDSNPSQGVSPVVGAGWPCW